MTKKSSKEKLTKESEQKLLNALEEISDLMQEGMEPNDAISKIAAEHKIQPGHIKLMVYAVNTGNINTQRLNNQDIFEKAADLPVADETEILSRIYPEIPHTKKSDYRTAVISSEYNKPPDWINKTRNFQKVSSYFQKSFEKKASTVLSEEIKIQKSLGDLQRLKHEINDVRQNLDKCRQESIKIASDIRTYFRYPQNTKYDDIVTTVKIVFGEPGLRALNSLDITKKASINNDKSFNINSTPYKEIKRLIDISKSFKQASDKYQSLLNKYESIRSNLVSPFEERIAYQRSVLADRCYPEKQTSSKLSKKANIGAVMASGLSLFRAMDIAKEIAQKFPGAVPDYKKLEKQELRDFMDPFYERDKLNLQLESNVNKMMAFDDVISGFSPEDVAEAVEESLQVDPYAVSHYPRLRNLVRMRLTGGPQAFDQFLIGDSLKHQQLSKELLSPEGERLSVLSNLEAIPERSKKDASIPI